MKNNIGYKISDVLAAGITTDAQFVDEFRKQRGLTERLLTSDDYDLQELRQSHWRYFMEVIKESFNEFDKDAILPLEVTGYINKGAYGSVYRARIQEGYHRFGVDVGFIQTIL